MALFDTTGPIYLLLEAITNNITGHIFLTLLFLSIIALIFLMAFKIPVEVGVILLSPFIIVIMAYRGEFAAVGGIMLIWMAIIFGRRFFLFNN